MENCIIKNRIKKLNSDTKEILEQLISDSILEMECRNKINKDILDRIILVYLSLFGKKNLLEYDTLSFTEKNVIYRIISKGIASIYVDDEYLNHENAKNKLFIIEDMINLLCFLTDFNKSVVKRLVRKDIKIYFYHGWKWDFI